MKNKRHIITFEVPKELKEKIDKYVEKNNLNLSEMLRKFCVKIVK